jgi:phage tail sheath protein FI
MPFYSTPDVYIEEISAGARPIEPVGTSTAGFVGVAPYAKAHRPDMTKSPEAVAVNNWTEFVREFCIESGADPNDLNARYSSTWLSQAVYGFFLNGGSRCYVVNVGVQATARARRGAAAEEGESAAPGGADQGVDDAARRGAITDGLAVLDQYDEIAIVAAPGYTAPGDYEAILAHCENLKDRVAVLDAAASETKPDDLIPDENRAVTRPRQSDLGFGALYYPWIRVRDPLSSTGEIVTVPPSGHMAGIWARTDATRGVHKAPANEAVRGAVSLTYRLTRQELGILNQNSVNCIRFFAREGIRVWGARTLAATASEWRYLNVRRLFNMIEESIAENTRWIVFEPNDRTLWKSITRDVTAFLMNIWASGALMGATPEQAFFVKCDEETNPPESIDAGYVITLVGIAPVKPAEFVVFRISQYAEGTKTETVGEA